MGVITISLNDGIEKKLRKIAVARFGKKKGYLAKAITEALERWSESEKNDNVIKTLKMLEKGFNLGGINYKKREELHRG